MQKKTAPPAKPKVTAPKKVASPVKKDAPPSLVAKKEPILTKPSPAKNVAVSKPKDKESPQKSKQPATKSVVKKEEEKKVEEKQIPSPEPKKQAVFPVREVKLQGIQDVVKEIWEKHGKIPLIMDESEQYTTFLKYKGSQADFMEFVILEKTGKKKKEEFLEEIRKMIYASMKSGHTFAFYFDKALMDVLEFFKEAPYFVMPQILTPKELVNPEFYKKKVLKPEEDKDTFGNQGYFEIKEDFNMVFLYNELNLEEITKKINVPLDIFEFVLIKK